MKRFLLHQFCPVALLLAVVSSGQAQTGYNRPATTPLSRPPVSPYLNLTRPGNRAINYYNLVRPEFEFRNAYQAIQGQVNRQGEEIQAAEAGLLPPTGHQATFLNYSHYFPARGGQGLNRGPGTSGVRTQPQGVFTAPRQGVPARR